MEDETKKKNRKGAEIWALKSFRDRSKGHMEESANSQIHTGKCIHPESAEPKWADADSDKKNPRYHHDASFKKITFFLFHLTSSPFTGSNKECIPAHSHAADSAPAKRSHLPKGFFDTGNKVSYIMKSAPSAHTAWNQNHRTHPYFPPPGQTFHQT